MAAVPVGANPCRGDGDAGVGDVDGTVGADGDVVQETGVRNRPLAERLAGGSVETAYDVDVRHVEAVGMDGAALGGVQRDTRIGAVYPLQVEHLPVR